MPQSAGPKLANKENLMFTYQPGGSTPFSNFTASLAEDAAALKRGTVQGPRRKNAEYTSTYDDRNSSGNYQRVPVLSLQNIASSVYDLNTASTNTYTLSLWVKVVEFPTKYGSTQSERHQQSPEYYGGDSGLVTKSKRAALARFDYSFSGTGTQYNGFIQFGAMAPYYKNASGTPNYKSVFSPISFGAAICCRHYQASVYTDYKFNLNQWYLLTIQLQSNSTFASSAQTLNVKMFVNNSQENIAKCLGIAWQQNKGIIRDSNGDFMRFQNAKRKTGLVAGQPGFYNCSTGGTVSNASSQSITYNYFMNLSRLNCISYSPILQFGGLHYNGNDGNTSAGLSGNGSSNFCQMGSSINFGQTYIYNTAFNSSLYTQFKGLYS
jgi:hypothetical protein